MNAPRGLAWALALLTPWSMGAAAGAGAEGDAAAETCTVVQGGDVYTPTGWRAGWGVRIDGGRISEVSPQPPAGGCQLVDARGAKITPGLIEVATQVGLLEVEAEPSSVHAGAGALLGWSGVRPSYRVAWTYNPRSVVIPVTRRGGLTSAVVVPRGGLVAGQSAWVQLTGGTQAQAVLRDGVALHVSLDGAGARGDGWHALDVVLDEADTLARERAEWERNAARPFRVPASELEALTQARRGEQPVVVGADRAADIERAVRWAQARGLRLVIRGGAEAWMLAEVLGRAQVPVVLDPLLDAPESFDALGARADNAALLHAAGVPVVLSTFDTHNARLLTQAAGNAVRAGLPHEAALDAVTRTPARVFDLDGAGRLEAGARADVVVFSGDPFELSTYATHVFIGGRSVDLSTRQTRLRDRYRALPGRPAPLTVPSALPARPQR